MTTQIPETLIFGSRSTFFYKEVLQGALRNPADYEHRLSNTALMRGYCGHWRIRGRRLYLSHIFSDGWLTMERLFPGCNGEVFADWFTGRIALPYGGCLSYRVFGRGFAYASYLQIEFESGVVVRTWIDDCKPKLPDAEIPDWMRSGVELRRNATVAPLPQPTTEGDYMPSRVIEALLNEVPPVRAWRLYLGLKENELAAQAGISGAELLACEQRQATACPESFDAIARALGLTREDLEYV